jgi:NADH-quinone oxidoreductase subunit C
MNDIIEMLGKRVSLTAIDRKRENLAFVTMDHDSIIPTLQFLRENEGYTHLVLITAVDWLERGKFQLTWLLNNPEKKCDLGLRTEIDRDNASMESAHRLWATAGTFQRELREMFGIDFPGSPRVDEEFILEGWKDMPPYRRDFDTLKYAEDTYFPRPGRSKEDPKDYMKQKLYGEWRGDSDV